MRRFRGVQPAHRSAHLHLFGDGAHFEHEVRGRPLIDIELHTALQDRLETGAPNADFIGTRRQQGKGVEPYLVGFGMALGAIGGIADGDVRTWHDRSGGIDYSAIQLCRLRQGCGREQ